MDDNDWLESHNPKDLDWHEIQKAAPTTHLLPDDDKQPEVEPEEPLPQFSAPTQHLIPDQSDDKGPSKEE